MPMRALDALAYNAAVDATISDPDLRASNRIWVPLSHRIFANWIARNGYEYRLESQHKYWWQHLYAWARP
jgi:hypothetical protein